MSESEIESRRRDRRPCGGCGQPQHPADLRLLRLPVETGVALEVRDLALCGTCRGLAARDAERYGRAYQLLGLAT